MPILGPGGMIVRIPRTKDSGGGRYRGVVGLMVTGPSRSVNKKNRPRPSALVGGRSVIAERIHVEPVLSGAAVDTDIAIPDQIDGDGEYGPDAISSQIPTRRKNLPLSFPLKSPVPNS